MTRFAPEGYPFMAVFGLITVVAMMMAGAAYAAVPAMITLFMFWFFRDPERLVPADAGVMVCPADGKVIVIRDTDEERHLHAKARQISIFMSPLNVHVNRVPCDGTVKKVQHNKGRFLAAYKDDASIRNENIEMVFSSGFGDILLRQVAGFVARRAVCRVTPGAQLKQGERYGMIKFSSRVDIYLPEGCEIKVSMGQAVRAGETVIAVYRKGV